MAASAAPATSVMRLLDLAGRSAVVSGSSGGIGGAVARALALQGCRVFGLDSAAPPLPPLPPLPPPPLTPPPPPAAASVVAAASTSSALSASAPASASVQHVPCDLRDPEGAERALRGLGLAQLDFLVNVAGVDPKFSLAEGGPREWAGVHDLNLRGMYLLTRAAAPLLARGAGRSVVNVSSINTNLGVRRRSIYSASKAGVVGLTTGLARELGDERIRINCVSPGWVMTPAQLREYGFGEPRGREVEAYLDGVQSLAGKRIAPDEVAGVVLFLLSAASGAVTGTNITCDAGWRLQ